MGSSELAAVASVPGAATPPHHVGWVDRVGRMLSGTLGRAGGALLAAAFGLTAQVRGTRALHPVGVCGHGRLSIVPGPASGVVVLDHPGPHAGAVRWSRATGRQRGRDIEGLGLRLQGPGEGDVLLASTGTGVVGRHVLRARGALDHGLLSTLLPLQTVRGPLLLALEPEPSSDAHPPTTYRLLVSAPGHPWHERGRLEISWTDRDCLRRHDPVGHPPVGTWTHPFWARLRDPAYGASQQVPARAVEPETIDPPHGVPG